MSTQTQLRPIEWSDEELEQAINGAFNVYRWNRHIPYKLTAKERTNFEQAKQQGYIGLGARDPLVNAFHTWCEIHQHPLISVEGRGRYACVKMDLIYCEDDLPDDRRGFNEQDTEKLHLVYDAICSTSAKPSLASLGGTYTYINRVDRPFADLVAQAFVAIYRQSRGNTTIRVPVLPVPTRFDSMATRVQNARSQHWIHTHGTRDPLLWRWKYFCDANGWSYIVVQETRKGHSHVEVKLPEPRTFTEAQIFSLRHIGKEAGVQSSFDCPAGGAKRKWFYLGERRLKTITSIPTDAACYFAESITNLLMSSGYFPPVDESWHE